MTKRIARSWLLLTVAGIAVYLALFAVGVLDSPLTKWYLPSSGIWAVALGALAVSILLALDEHPARGEENVEKMTFAGLAYVLFVKRKPLLALLVLSVAGVGLAVYYVSKSIGVTFETEGSTFSVKLPGQTVYYFPIHSQQGWQNTGIKLKADQTFKYSITGSVSPGYLQDIDERSRKLREYRMNGEEYKEAEPDWPFTGPEGLLAKWYKDIADKDRRNCDKAHGNNEKAKQKCYSVVTKHFDDDTGLTVQGVAHNRVVGIILAGEEPHSAGGGKPGYDYRRRGDTNKLILFDGTAPTQLKTAKANADGVLWIVINDADVYRWDNAGLFFLKLVIP